MRTIIALILIYLIPNQFALSQYYYPYYYQQPIIQEKIVIRETIVPVAVPVVIPATVFQYLPALQQLPQTNVVNVQPAQAAVQNVQPSKDKLIDEKIAALRRTGSPPPLILYGQLPQDNTNTSNSNDNQEFAQKVAQMLADKGCIACHTKNEKVSGGITLFTKTNDQYQFTPDVDPDTLLKAVNPKKPSMPPDVTKDPSKGLNEEQFNLLKKLFNK